MAKKRRAIGPVESIERSDDGHANKIVETGVTRRITSGTFENGKFKGQLSGSLQFFSFIRGEPIFTSIGEEVLEALEENNDLPADVHEFLGKPCVEQLRTLAEICKAYEIRKLPKSAAVRVPQSPCKWSAPADQSLLHDALSLAFYSGKECGKLEVARLALIGLRQSRRGSETAKGRRIPDSVLRRRWQAVQDELEKQSRRGEKLHRQRAYEAAGAELGLSPGIVKKAFLYWGNRAN